MIEELITQKEQLQEHNATLALYKKKLTPRFDSLPIFLIDEMQELRESQIVLIDKMIALINENERVNETYGR